MFDHSGRYTPEEQNALAADLDHFTDPEHPLYDPEFTTLMVSLGFDREEWMKLQTQATKFRYR